MFNRVLFVLVTAFFVTMNVLFLFAGPNRVPDYVRVLIVRPQGQQSLVVMNRGRVIGSLEFLLIKYSQLLVG